MGKCITQATIGFAFSVLFPLVRRERLRLAALTRRAAVCRSRSLDPDCGGVDRNARRATLRISPILAHRLVGVVILVHSARTCALRDCFLFRLCSKIASIKLNTVFKYLLNYKMTNTMRRATFLSI